MYHCPLLFTCFAQTKAYLNVEAVEVFLKRLNCRWLRCCLEESAPTTQLSQRSQSCFLVSIKKPARSSKYSTRARSNNIRQTTTFHVTLTLDLKRLRIKFLENR